MKKELPALRKKNTIQDYVEAILFAFVVAMIIRNYTFQNFQIPSESMESTLLIGDFLVANKLKYYFNEPKREEIVTFRYPADPPHLPADKYWAVYPPIYVSKSTLLPTYYSKKNIVKRVVGMPGDTISISNKHVYINGKLHEPPYVKHKDYRTFRADYEDPHIYPEFTGNRDNIAPFVVPQGHYFVMGDNRDNSLDSRFWGFLTEKDITGTPSLIFFSLDDDPHKGLFNSLRSDRFLKEIK